MSTITIGHLTQWEDRLRLARDQAVSRITWLRSMRRRGYSWLELRADWPCVIHAMRHGSRDRMTIRRCIAERGRLVALQMETIKRREMMDAMALSADVSIGGVGGVKNRLEDVADDADHVADDRPRYTRVRPPQVGQLLHCGVETWCVTQNVGGVVRYVYTPAPGSAARYETSRELWDVMVSNVLSRGGAYL